MSETNLISVIIPFYKNSKWLSEALESVYEQTYKNFEIILVNDGSKEDINQIIDKFSAKMIYIYKNNSGPGETRNIGIETANGDYIAFLDSDDIWLPNKLRDQLDFMLKNDFIWCHTAGLYFWENSKKRKPYDFHRNVGDISKRGFLSLKMATPSVMIKSSVIKLDKRYRFNPQMRFSQDYPLFISLAQRYPLGYLNKKCVLIRIREKSNGFSINTALRIRLRFTCRAKMLELYKSDTDLFYGKNKYNNIIHFLHLYYYYANLFLIFLEKFLHENTIEFLSKTFYTVPYTFERLYVNLIDLKKRFV